MEKQLMHKNTVVADISLSKNNRNVNAVKVREAALFPYAGDTDVNNMRRWLLNRKTVTNRADIAPLTRFYGEEHYISENLSSLTDCYWIRDKNDKATWEEISPYHITDFETDSIFLSIIKPNDFDGFSENSPNLTIAKPLPLFWYMTDDTKERGLLNFEAQKDMDIWKEAKALGINIIKERRYLILAGHICTFVKTSTSEEIEKIPLGQLYLSTQDTSLSKKENLEKCCIHYQIPGWEDFIREILLFNRQTKTEQIDLLDVGVLRDTETLRYIGIDKI